MTIHKTLFLLFSSLLVLASNTGSAQKRSPNENSKAMTFEITGYSIAHIKRSKKYGGCGTKFEVLPPDYFYTYFDANLEKNKAYKDDFLKLINKYISSIMVNNTVTLKEYLTYLYFNDTTQINEVHKKNDIRMSVLERNSVELLPKLFFVDNNKRVLKVIPYSVSLSWDDATAELFSFLQKKAFRYESKIIDEFLKKHYYSYENQLLDY